MPSDAFIDYRYDAEVPPTILAAVTRLWDALAIRLPRIFRYYPDSESLELIATLLEDQYDNCVLIRRHYHSRDAPVEPYNIRRVRNRVLDLVQRSPADDVWAKRYQPLLPADIPEPEDIYPLDQLTFDVNLGMRTIKNKAKIPYAEESDEENPAAPMDTLPEMPAETPVVEEEQESNEEAEDEDPRPSKKAKLSKGSPPELRRSHRVKPSLKKRGPNPGVWRAVLTSSSEGEDEKADTVVVSRPPKRKADSRPPIKESSKRRGTTLRREIEENPGIPISASEVLPSLLTIDDVARLARDNMQPDNRCQTCRDLNRSKSVCAYRGENEKCRACAISKYRCDFQMSSVERERGRNVSYSIGEQSLANLRRLIEECERETLQRAVLLRLVNGHDARIREIQRVGRDIIYAMLRRSNLAELQPAITDDCDTMAALWTALRDPEVLFDVLDGTAPFYANNMSLPDVLALLPAAHRVTLLEQVQQGLLNMDSDESSDSSDSSSDEEEDEVPAHPLVDIEAEESDEEESETATEDEAVVPPVAPGTSTDESSESSGEE
ncbi:hypothetical protein GALMADRAFT_144542 [Galerina marginata CBS 339.88]|uniref:Uncharacterized protein n=1 Tax=Galerina marginata (strain CBS 339.88) TaxID=685588 RepID=A0A067SSI3_GALM3|nr:hypothetical protein GALMADRAFT_144542 [Galerina marginata CBS 339.88]